MTRINHLDGIQMFRVIFLDKDNKREVLLISGTDLLDAINSEKVSKKLNIIRIQKL